MVAILAPTSIKRATLDRTSSRLKHCKGRPPGVEAGHGRSISGARKNRMRPTLPTCREMTLTILL
jgi:hypothetical protein